MTPLKVIQNYLNDAVYNRNDELFNKLFYTTVADGFYIDIPLLQIRVPKSPVKVKPQFYDIPFIRVEARGEKVKYVLNFELGHGRNYTKYVVELKDFSELLKVRDFFSIPFAEAKATEVLNEITEVLNRTKFLPFKTDSVFMNEFFALIALLAKSSDEVHVSDSMLFYTKLSWNAPLSGKKVSLTAKEFMNEFRIVSASYGTNVDRKIVIVKGGKEFDISLKQEKFIPEVEGISAVVSTVFKEKNGKTASTLEEFLEHVFNSVDRSEEADKHYFNLRSLLSLNNHPEVK